ncbi:MAG: single-stranded DNA-binding protein [Alphaproteobacteria bacterium]|nr:single-stranded DNA-binding protein [Alphaproteobacteria bacterium]
MASYLNRIHLIGDIDRPPEIRHTQSGKKVAIFRVATSDYWTDKLTQQLVERTQWHRVVVFHPGFVDLIEREVTRGTKVYIEGQLQTRKWKDNHDHSYTVTEVVLHPIKSEFFLLGTFPLEERVLPSFDTKPLTEPEDMGLPSTEES